MAHGFIARFHPGITEKAWWMQVSVEASRVE
jgi:hypothetical protein